MKKICFLPLFFLLISCGGSKKPVEPTPTPSPTPIKNVCTLDHEIEEFDIHTETQRNYFLNPNYKKINDYTGAGVVDESKSISLTISWSWEYEVEEQSFILSENEELNNAKTYVLSENSIELSNLKIGMTYYFKITANKDESDIYSFSTRDLGLRNMNVATLSNIRDLGGIHLDNNKRIKQGMIYRSAEMNETYTQDTLVSEADINLLTNEFGIKSDIDLRNNVEVKDKIETGGITSSPLGENVNYVPCPMLFGGQNILTRSENQESIKDFFTYLGEESHYPMVFHCAQGKDRTGCMAYIIEALLGADIDIMMRDYLFTNFSDVNGVCKPEDVNVRYGETLDLYEQGETLKEKTYNYLVNEIGVESQYLDNIISLLTE